ncbi:MAG: hypothetical protein ACWGSQ_03740 [Longimicrobiales bacterium]
MPPTRRSFLPILLLLAGSASPSWGQSRDRGPIVLDLPASTRALALGNAFALGFRDSDAVFYHPGLLNQAEGMAAGLQWFGAGGTLTGLSAAQAWFGGGVALGIQHLAYQVPAESIGTVDGILGLPADEGSLRDSGEAGASETVVSAGYGRTLMGIRMGAVAKFIDQNLGYRTASTMAVDVGIAMTPGPITMALSAQNLGPALGIAGGDVPLPTRFTLGASSRTAPVGPLDVSVSSALSYRLDGDLIPSLGLEVGYWPVNGRTFVGRAGYRYRSNGYSATPLTFGGAFLGDNIILEYAYQGFESGDPSHRFSLGWR